MLHQKIFILHETNFKKTNTAAFFLFRDLKDDKLICRNNNGKAVKL